MALGTGRRRSRRASHDAVFGEVSEEGRLLSSVRACCTPDGSVTQIGGGRASQSGLTNSSKRYLRPPGVSIST